MWNYQDFTDSTKNSFHGNYTWKYGKLKKVAIDFITNHIILRYVLLKIQPLKQSEQCLLESDKKRTDPLFSDWL